MNALTSLSCCLPSRESESHNIIKAAPLTRHVAVTVPHHANDVQGSQGHHRSLARARPCNDTDIFINLGRWAAVAVRHHANDVQDSQSCPYGPAMTAILLKSAHLLMLTMARLA